MEKVRLNIVLVLFILFAAAIVGRLFFLQILRGEFYKALSQGQRGFFEETSGQRGEIFSQDKEGKLYLLATDRKMKFVFVSSAEIKEKEKTAEILSQILKLDKKELLAKISKEDSLYEFIKSRLTDEEIEGIIAANLEGVHIKNQILRYFPQNTFAAHVVGFVGADGIGQYGLEGYYDNILQRKSRIFEGQGWLLPEIFWQLNRQKGADLILTIDENIQFFAEKVLQEAIDKLSAKEGEIIVMDPNTGKIFAFADFPSFDPNQYFAQKNLEIFQNSAIQKIFEPGSAFKPFTMASALDQGKVTPETKYIDEGIVQVGGYAIYNYDNRVWGERTMTEVLEKSINTGAVFAERQLGHKLFLDYVKRFGFTEPTGVDLQGEIFSENKTLKSGREINFATASFGQGIEVTSIQMLRAFAALVNGGRLVKPYMVDKIIKPDGSVEVISPEIGEQVISRETSAKISAMMVSVVENGFGKAARIPGYYVGGKTGTAQVPWTALGISKSGYSEKTIQSFLGFAPALDPRFVILVKLHDPKTKTAEYSAVPVFHDLAKYILDYWEIPPDHEI